MTTSDQPNLPHAALLQEAIAYAPQVLRTVLDEETKTDIAHNTLVLAEQQKSEEVKKLSLQCLPEGTNRFLGLVSCAAVTRNENDTVTALSYLEKHLADQKIDTSPSDALLQAFVLFSGSEILRKVVVPYAAHRHFELEGEDYALAVAESMPAGMSFEAWASVHKVDPYSIKVAALQIFDITSDPTVLMYAVEHECFHLKGTETWTGVSAERMEKLQKIYTKLQIHYNPETAERFARIAAISYEKRVASVGRMNGGAQNAEQLSLDCYERIKKPLKPRATAKQDAPKITTVLEALAIKSPVRQERVLAETYRDLAEQVLASYKHIPITQVGEATRVPFMYKQRGTKKRWLFGKR